MKRIWSTIAEKKWQHCFPLYVYWDFFRHSRAANSAVGGRIWPNFKLLRVLMHIIIICKYEKDRMKNSWEKVFAIITLSVAMETSGLIWPNFELIPTFMYVIITCKYEKDPIKNNQEKVATPFFKLYYYLLPWKQVVGSGRISNSSKLLCMSSLPGTMKRIRWTIAEKMWWHHLLLYMSMGFFSDAQGQPTP